MSSGGDVPPTLEPNLRRPATRSPADIPGTLITFHDLDQPDTGSRPVSTISETLASISFRLDLILTMGATLVSVSSSDHLARTRPQKPVPVHERRT